MSTSQAQENENPQVSETEALVEANRKIAQISRDLDELQTEQKLMHKLAAAGAVDLETAVLVAKARMTAARPHRRPRKASGDARPAKRWTPAWSN